MTTQQKRPRPERRGPGTGQSAGKENREVDRASADSMDASDPPSFNPGTAGAAEGRRSPPPKPQR